VPRLSPLAPVLAAVALTVAACGGGGGGSLSRSEFIAKADALCRQANKVPPPGPVQSPEQAAANARREARQRTALKQKLGKLEPPSALEREYARYQAQTDQLISLFRQEAAAAQAKDVRRFNQLDSRISTLSAQRAKTGGRIGFTVCGGAVSAKTAADPALARTVDAACAAANHTAQTATPQPSSATDTAAFAKIGPGILAAQRKAQGAIRAQQPSAQVKALYGEFASAFSARVDVTARQLAAAKAKDGAKLQALTDQDQQIVNRREGPAAQKLGFEVCGILGENGV
jgi:hypothetical protein